MFEYSRHKTRDEAEAAIETYFAAGAIDVSDHPEIKVDRLSRIGLCVRPFRVMLGVER